MSRNKEVDMLDFIYQNSQMGVASLNEILPMVEEGKFKESLRSQLKGYNDKQKK